MGTFILPAKEQMIAGLPVGKLNNLENRVKALEASGGGITPFKVEAGTPAFGYSSSALRGIFDLQNSITVGDVASVTVVQENGPYNRQDYGYGFNIEVYAFKIVGSGRVYSTTPATYSITDSNTGTVNYRWQINYTSVSDADGYKIVVIADDWYGAYGDFVLETVINPQYVDDGSEYTYESPPVVLPKFVGPDFYIDSDTGNTITAGSITADTFTGTGTGVNTFGGPLDIQADGVIAGTDYAVRIRQVNPSTAMNIRYQGDVNAKFSFRVTNGNTDEKAWQFVANSIGQFYLGNLNDGEGFENQPVMWTRSGTTPTGMRVNSPMSIARGINAPTAKVHIGAGSTSASSAPIKFTSGSRMTTPEVGAMEFDTDNLYFTITTAAARKPIVLSDVNGGLTSGRVPYATTNGRLRDSTNLLFSGTALTVDGGGSKGGIDLIGTGGGDFRIAQGTTVASGYVSLTYSSPKLGLTRSGTHFLWYDTGNGNLVLNNTFGGTSYLSLAYGGTDVFRVDSASSLTALANLTISTKNIVTDTTTGTKIGTGTTQKLGFWNATPIVQPANTVAIDTALVNMGLMASGGVALFDTDIKAGIVGKGVYVKEGTNATMGLATLVAGTVVVNTTKVTANSRIFLTAQTLGTVTIGQGLAVSARTAGTSFTITSGSAVDTSTVAWLIVEPA